MKKINEAEWEIPKEGNMNVPIKIIGTEKLIEQMKRDRTFNQIKNVSTLPGIIKHALVMPDGHEGYGFPIGGVAAFDLETGVIPPGGVGYDINCLTGDTKIPTPYGWYLKIKDYNFLSDISLVTNGNTYLFNTLQNYFVSSKQGQSKVKNFMYKEYKGEIYKIKTTAGILKCTEEHPIFTINGKKSIDILTIKDMILCNPHLGVEYKKYKGIEEDKKLSIFSKIFGYLLGDGTIYKTKNKFYAVAYGTEEDLKKMSIDLKSIGYSSKTYHRLRDHCIKGKSFKADNWELHIYSKEFIEKLIKLGMPLGNKTKTKFEIPNWIIKGPKWIKKQFLAGYFGAEMSKPKSMSKTCLYLPDVTMTKETKLIDNLRFFMLQISKILEEFDIEVSKISIIENEKDKSRIRLLINGKPKNLIKLYSKIGFEYNNKRDFLAKCAILYLRKKIKNKKERSELAKWIKNKKEQGFKAKEIKKILNEKINDRFIERAFYENCTTRLTLDFPSFKNFVKEQKEYFEVYGTLIAEIISIEKRKFEGRVYDFTIEKDHNFVANGIIVSNCGVRLVTTGLTVDQVKPKIDVLIKKLFDNVPSGVGSKSKLRLDENQLKDALINGVEWAVKNGYGRQEDIENCEEYGKMEGADPSAISQQALKRGKPQFGTLGAGNHFLEVQKVDEILSPEIAEKFGLKKDQVVVMIHCGSRGLGHQICGDYIDIMLRASEKYGIKLADKELCCAPIKSEEAQNYMKAMKCAVNYAFTNRQVIMHWVRETFDEVFGKGTSNDMHLVYDVAHNIAKIEEHEVDGKTMKVCVHRKGATRAFAKGRKELPKKYIDIGQPVLIPGSMGTASYVLVGKQKGMEVSFGSTCHGAGRVMSRSEAIRSFTFNQIKEEMNAKGIKLLAADRQVAQEEASGAYKDVDEVVKSVALADISEIVVKLKPIGVVKG
ncbi:MAG: RtcB family protein [Candidatus Micrarchaeia archaeon]|jgi:tRNA-splicing ligase RtcB